eukprot:535186_1
MPHTTRCSSSSLKQYSGRCPEKLPSRFIDYVNDRFNLKIDYANDRSPAASGVHWNSIYSINIDQIYPKNYDRHQVFMLQLINGSRYSIGNVTVFYHRNQWMC